MSFSTPGFDKQRARAKEFIANGKFYEAENLLRMLLKANSGDSQSWHFLGNSRYRRGDYDQAIVAYRERLRLEPSAVAHYSLAVALLRVEQQEEALELLHRALELQPNMSEARAILAKLDPLVDHPKVGQPVSTPSLSRLIDQGKIGPGPLRYQGSRLLRSYIGHFALAGVLALAGLTGMAGARRLQPVADWLAGVQMARDQHEIGPVAPVTGRNLKAAEDWADNLNTLFFVFFGGLVVLAIGLVGHAVLSCEGTRYSVYERRVDFTQGVAKRATDSVWLYEVTDIKFAEPLTLRLGRTASIVLQTEKEQSRIIGTSTASDMHLLWVEMRDQSLVQRKSIKGVWV